jgi:hypothetical protein
LTYLEEEVRRSFRFLGTTSDLLADIVEQRHEQMAKSRDWSKSVDGFCRETAELVVCF